MADPRTLPAHSLTTWTLSGWGCRHCPHHAAFSAWGRLSTPSMWSAAGSSRTPRTAWTQSCAMTGCKWAGPWGGRDPGEGGPGITWDSQEACTDVQALGGDLSRGTGRLVHRPKTSGEGAWKDLNALSCVLCCGCGCREPALMSA